jgi:hypothetical protein
LAITDIESIRTRRRISVIPGNISGLISTQKTISLSGELDKNFTDSGRERASSARIFPHAVRPQIFDNENSHRFEYLPIHVLLDVTLSLVTFGLRYSLNQLRGQMLILFNRFLFAGLFIVVFPIHGSASPANSKLLPLIPREAQIVAGVEDPGNPDTRGHLLLVTVKNTFDFDDCLSLTGVDTHRGVDETIWLAASSPQGELYEHMLLIAGRFDRKHIFQAAEQNGAETRMYRGLEVLLVKPFTREEMHMHDTRWMVILDGQAAVFGTLSLVQKALDRYVGHEPADSLVADRLRRLHPQVNSWNVLVMPHEMSSKRAALGQSVAPWIDLLGKDMLDGADELTLGIRYGATARVDFVVRMAENRTTPSSSDGVAPQHLFEAGSLRRLRTRFEHLTVEQNLIQGSIVLPGKQLDACFTLVSCGGSVETLRGDR